MKALAARRYAVFVLGLAVISLAVGFITKADLGTSAITAIPYSLSMAFPDLSMGAYVTAFNILLILLQVSLTDWKRSGSATGSDIAVEFAACFLFGYMVDLSMALFRDLNPDVYVLQVLCVLIGILLLAFGVYLQIIAGVAMLPGDGFVYALTLRLRKDVGTVRICSDTSMVAIAALIGLVFLGNLGGVREGSVMCCILTGFVSRRYMSLLAPLTDRLVPGTDLSRLTRGRKAR